MRYRIEFCLNPDVVLIHVGKLLLPKDTKIIVYEYELDKVELQSAFVKHIFQINSIENLSFGKYHIQIEK